MVSAYIASAIGAPEGAIKLLLSIFAGYPLALLHRLPLFYAAPSLVKHLLLFLEGASICYYNFGIDTVHMWLNVTIIYLLVLLCGGTKFSVIFAFVFNTCYLLIGYYTQVPFQDFGISWTMPHCVLTLRLTGVAFDYYDSKRRTAGNDVELTEKPGYLEMLGHTFFFGGVLVGPQFSLKRYLNFVNGKYTDRKTGGGPKSVHASLEKLAVGVFYLGMFQLLALYIPDSYLTSPSFHELGFLTKCALITIWGKNALHKYVGVWLIQEGSIILTGMSYNGVEEKGVAKWDGCTNIKVWQLETGESFSDFIQSFNVNTNQWMARYVYKRLRFLGSKVLSQLLTLLYLALWHGLLSGYYMCFFLELLLTHAELQAKHILGQLHIFGNFKRLTILDLFGRFIRKTLLMFLWSYSLVSFVLLQTEKWMSVYWSVYFAGHISCLLVIAVAHALHAVKKSKPLANGVHLD
ncbi:hypothetical protein BsWGS_27042 [Bradybaena similaris]